jgi:hypothetical protein
MKSEVIEYIISTRTFAESEKPNAYSNGLALLYRLNPSHALTNSAYTPHNMQALIKTLGYHLRNNQLIEVVPVKAAPQLPTPEKKFKPSEKPIPEIHEAQQEEDHTDLSTEARINMDIHRMIKELRFFSRKLQAANSDHDRKVIYKEANNLNDAIERNKALLRQLQRGNKINYVNTYFEADGENDFEVPEKILELDKKYRLMMARRSKRLAKVTKKEALNGKDSPQHQQALSEWKHFDEVVKFLKTKLDEHK